MRTAVHLSNRQLATLVDAAGWSVVAWSPLASCLDAGRLGEGDQEFVALVDAGLLVEEDGRRRANLVVDTALAALARPEVCVEIAVPGSRPLVFCRAGTMVIGWYEFAPGVGAFTDAIPMPDLLALLDGLFGVDASAPPNIGSGPAVRVDRSELELLIALADWRRRHGESPGFARLVQVVDGDYLEGEAVDPEALEACLQGLLDQGHVVVEGTRLVLSGDAAGLLDEALTFGFSVRQVRVAEGAIATQRLNVYSSGARAVVVQDAGRSPAGEPAFNVWEASRAQLAALVLAATFGEDELGSLDATAG